MAVDFSALSAGRWEDTPAFTLQTPDHSPRVARVIDVHDGDTITVALPNPFMVQASAFVRASVRLSGVDCCELIDPDPDNRRRAREALTRTLANVLMGSLPRDGPSGAWQVAASLSAMDAGRRRAIREALQRHVCIASLRCGAFDKYGRLLACVRVLGDPGCLDLGDDLLRSGLAKPYSLI